MKKTPDMVMCLGCTKVFTVGQWYVHKDDCVKDAEAEPLDHYYQRKIDELVP